jgi:hypothetical protein
MVGSASTPALTGAGGVGLSASASASALPLSSAHWMAMAGMSPAKGLSASASHKSIAPVREEKTDYDDGSDAGEGLSGSPAGKLARGAATRSPIASARSSTGSGGGGGGGSGSGAVVPVNPQAARDLTLQTLVAQAVEGPPTLSARMDFVGRTANALGKVRTYLHSGALDPPVNSHTINLFKLKSEFNALRAKADGLSKSADSLHKQCDILQKVRSRDDAKELEQTNAQIKALNMKLVTLNTRLVEAEENKKNYEMYIMRMKEEDVHLSKQIDQMRHVVWGSPQHNIAAHGGAHSELIRSVSVSVLCLC